MKWLGREGQPRWFRRADGTMIREDGMSSVETARQCAKCGQHEAGTGNILCAECRQRIELQCALSE